MLPFMFSSPLPSLSLPLPDSAPQSGEREEEGESRPLYADVSYSLPPLQETVFPHHSQLGASPPSPQFNGSNPYRPSPSGYCHVQPTKDAHTESCPIHWLCSVSTSKGESPRSTCSTSRVYPSTYLIEYWFPSDGTSFDSSPYRSSWITQSNSNNEDEKEGTIDCSHSRRETSKKKDEGTTIIDCSPSFIHSS